MSRRDGGEPIAAPATLLAASLLLLALASPAAADVEVRGRVIGAPAETRVTLLPLGSDVAEDARHVSPGADGGFVIHAPRPGMWRVEVRAPGHLPLTLELIPLVAATSLPPVQLPQATTAAVEVVDAQGRGVGGARVLARAAERRGSSPWPEREWRPADQEAVADQAGVATLATGPGTRLDLAILASGYVPGTLDDVGAPATSVELREGIQRQLRFLAPSGAPIPGVALELGRRHWPVARADELGLLEVSVPARGELAVSYEAGDRRRPGERLGTAASGEADPLTVLMPPPAAVGGRVIDANSREPIAGVVVWPAEAPQRATRSDGHGDYLVDGLHPSESWFLAAADGFLPRLFQATPGWGRPGSAPTLALEAASELAGRTVDASGEALPAVEVAVVPARPSAGSALTPPAGDATLSDEAGRFVLRDLRAGEAYVLRATKEGRAPIERFLPPLPAGPTDLHQPLILDRGATVRGTLVDPSGAPVAGARVELRDPQDEASERYRATSDETGRFALSLVPRGTYRLAARHPQFATAERPVVVAGEAPGDDLEVHLPAIELMAGVSLTGRVTNETGEPLAGARVAIVEPGESSPPPDHAADDESAATDADGHFELPRLQPGRTVGLDVRFAGYAPERLAGIAVPRESPLDVVLEAAGELAGQVVDEDGAPLYRAAVSLFPGTASSALPTKSSLTDRRGRFVLFDVPAGDFVLTAMALGLRPAHQTIRGLAPGERRRGLVLRLVPGGTVRGEVRDPAGAPLANAIVQLLQEGPGGTGFHNAYHSVESDGEGRYELAGLPTGPLILAANHRGYARAVQHATVGDEPAVVNFRLAAGGEVAGRVVDPEGRPIAEAHVVLDAVDGGRARRTGGDAAGRFRFTGLEPASYRLTGAKEGYASRSLGELVEVREGLTTPPVELELSAGVTVTGRLLGVESASLARLDVRAIHPGLGIQRGIVEGSGSYRIEHLAPGPWILEVASPGADRRARRAVVLDAAQPTVEVDLDLDAGWTVAGIVRADSEPLSGARVEIGGLDVTVGGSALTDPGGGFEIAALETGTYRFVVYDAGGPRHAETLELDGDEWLELDLRSGALAGTVIDVTDGQGIDEVQVVLEGTGAATGRRVTTTASGGRFELDAVGAGSWQLRFQHPSYRDRVRPVTLTGQERQELSVELQPADGAEIEILRSDGTRPADVRVAFLSRDGRVIASGRYPADASGRVRLTPRAGTAVVLVAAEGAATTAIEAPGSGAASAGRVLLPLAASLRVEVPDLAVDGAPATLRIAGPDGRAAPVLDRFGRPVQDWPLLGGQTTVTDLPQGTWSLTVEDGRGRSWTSEVRLTAGAVVPAVLR